MLECKICGRYNHLLVIQSMNTNGINISEQLKASRDEMYGAFDLFHSHVKYTTSLMVSFLTALIAIMVLAIRLGGLDDSIHIKLFLLIGSLMFFLSFPIGYISKKILTRYFRVYVAAMHFANIIHKQYEFNVHPWLITEGLGQYQIKKNTLSKMLTNKVQNSELSCSLYLRIIDVITAFSCLIGLILLGALFKMMAPNYCT